MCLDEINNEGQTAYPGKVQKRGLKFEEFENGLSSVSVGNVQRSSWCSDNDS